MEKVIIVRYCEIHLKGKNRGYFERVFMNNMEKALSGIRHEIRRPSGRYLVEKFDEARAEEIVERLRRVHEPKAGHYDWFDEDTVHIVRADENI